MEQGQWARAAARVFDASASTPVRLAAAHTDFPLAMIRSEPDITPQELADALTEGRRVAVQLSSIQRGLIRAGYALKRAGGAGT